MSCLRVRMSQACVTRRVAGLLSLSGDWSCPAISRGHVFLHLLCVVRLGIWDGAQAFYIDSSRRIDSSALALGS
jgi:hypothetical protein